MFGGIQQYLHLLRRVKMAGLVTSFLNSFYKSIIENILTCSIMVWYETAVSDRTAL